MALKKPGASRGWIFLAWLAVFYAAWGMFVFVTGAWPSALERWPIALAMVFGSYFAGSTPVGGGSVAFPILVLIFDQSAALGRNFSLAIQSLGMSSAALFLWCTGRPVAWKFVRWAALGAVIGTPLGCALIAPHVADSAAKLVFAGIWAAFGVMALLRLKRLTTRGSPPLEDLSAAIMLGLVGGAFIVPVIGAGLDMLAFAYLVLRRRADVKIAVPTGMVIMAAASIAGLATNLALGEVPPGVWPNWLAAAPVVVSGAPLGALMVTLVARKVTMTIVALLCIAQFAWMCVDQRLGAASLGAALGVIVALLAVFALLERSGRHERSVMLDA